jgi:hypothetical protein
MTKNDAYCFAECLIGLVDTIDRWNFESMEDLLKMMRYPKVKNEIEHIANDRQRKKLISMGLNILPFPPDEAEDDYEAT